MELPALRCHNCGTTELKPILTYETKWNGKRRILECTQCGSNFSETRGTILAGLRTALSTIILVLKVRSEGLGLNAATRVYGVSKNTILSWERKFALLKTVLFLYSLSHQFLQMIIEGDELYTKVGKNVPAEESQGWTIVLMDRASRFIFELGCGRKDRKLFKKAMRTLCRIIEKGQDITLVTDGERRYGSILFEICQELIHSGQRGRPRKVLRKGVKVRRKNKGSQTKRKGRKRARYEAPCREHPQTLQNIDNKDIHANHLEGFNASLRRRNSAYRRKTNTYAKTEPSLQRTLDVQWIVHNFVRLHFTTKVVPAVALGIIDRGLTWTELFSIKVATH